MSSITTATLNIFNSLLLILNACNMIVDLRLAKSPNVSRTIIVIIVSHTNFVHVKDFIITYHVFPDYKENVDNVNTMNCFVGKHGTHTYRVQHKQMPEQRVKFENN